MESKLIYIVDLKPYSSYSHCNPMKANAQNHLNKSTDQSLPRQLAGDDARANNTKLDSERKLSNCRENKLNVGATQNDIIKMLKVRITKAYRDREIFIDFMNYPVVRNELLMRGWLEKIPAGRFPKLQNRNEQALLRAARKGNEFEAILISKLMSSLPAYFVWQPKYAFRSFPELRPYRNRIQIEQRLDFTWKFGLNACVEHKFWYRSDANFCLNYPRMYRLCGEEKKQQFVNDFRRTLCRCLLSYIREHINTPEILLDAYAGSILPKTLEWALKNVAKYNNDIAEENQKAGVNKEQEATSDVEWQEFEAQVHQLIRGQSKIKMEVSDLKKFAMVAMQSLSELERKFPNYKWDGYRNLWILKPANELCGKGIVIRYALNDIMDWTTKNWKRNYLVQKYIERPYLINNTKFDIRIYTLLTVDSYKATIWIYKDCYIKLSSRPFTLDDLNESIHLTNHTVQKRYPCNQDIRMPKNNMWYLDQLKLYLEQNGAPKNAWSKIFKTIAQNIISVISASFEAMKFIENEFELYGADFMLAEDLTPILIEVNHTPDLSPSTEVTSRVCANLQSDLVKVVVDLPKNTRAFTGQFEKVFEYMYKIPLREETVKKTSANTTPPDIEREGNNLGPTERQKLALQYTILK